MTPSDPSSRPTRVPSPVAPLKPRTATSTSPWKGVLRGAAAGAAGTTALNAVTYLDMAVRGRPASDAPTEVVHRLADRVGVRVPGSRDRRANRFAGLGPLAGIATGVGVGAVAGVLRGAGVRLPTAVGGPLLGAAAMLASDVPLAVFGVSDPHRWSAVDWMSDAVPHLVYGVTTHATLVAAAEAEEERVPVPAVHASALLRAAALGAASGSRSTAGVTAVAFTSTRGDRGALASGLGSTAGKAVTAAAAAGELVADQLPSTPSRLAPPALGGRLVFGGAAAAAVARRDGHDPVLPALVATAAALGGALLGSRFRALAAQRFGSDRPGAFLEDGAAALLAWLGARRPAV